MKGKVVVLLVCLVVGLSKLRGQTERYYNPYISTTSVGVGGVLLDDRYLSPLPYGGYNLSIQSERIQFQYRRANNIRWERGSSLTGASPRERSNRWLSYRLWSVDYSDTKNPAQNASIMRIQTRWEVSRLYRLTTGEFGSLDVGAGYTAGIGGLYSSRNGNNPATLKADLSLTLALHYSYRLPWRSFPAVIRLASRTDLFGTQFSQQFGESYFELYYVSREYARRFHLVHLGNQIGQQLRLSIDLPIMDRFVASLSYRFQHRTWDVSHLYNRQTDHTFSIGLVRYLQPHGGRTYMHQNASLPF